MQRTALSLTAVLSLSAFATCAHAQFLGSAQAFVVLGGSTVTNTGPTVLTGDAGVWPGVGMTGFPPAVVIGTIHITDAVALEAHNDAVEAFGFFSAMAPTASLTGTDLGGLTLTPGIYFFASSAFLTGTLTLDAQGNPDALFIFQIGSTLISGSNSSVLTIGGADGCNVYWRVGSSATLGTGTMFQGTILAQASITLTTGVTIPDGRVIALDGAVTMDTNTISSDCLTVPAPGAGAVLMLSAAVLTRRRR